MKALLTLYLVFLAASEDCCDSQSEVDEVQLLQVRSHDGQVQIPSLDKIPDRIPGLDKIPGLEDIVDKVADTVKKTMGTAKEMANKGITSVSEQLTDALDKVDLEIQSATKKFNRSVHAFYAGANMTDDVAQNFTKLQQLVSDTVEDLTPCYKATLDNVNEAITASKTVMSAMGQQELLEKLGDCESTALNKLVQLADAAEEMGRHVADSSSRQVGTAVDFLVSKTQLAADITKDLRKQFDEKVQSFGAALQPKLEFTLGDKAALQVASLTNKTDQVFGNLEAFLTVVNTELPKCGHTVDYNLELSKQRGFWSHIFGGLFGR